MSASISAISRGAFEIHFPKRFTFVMKAMRLLPFAVYQRVVRRFTRG